MRTRKRLNAVSTKPSDGRRALPPAPVGTEPVEATATIPTSTTTAAPIASVRAVDPPRRGALPSMPDETNDPRGTLAPPDGRRDRQRHPGQLLGRGYACVGGGRSRGRAPDARRGRRDRRRGG